jgi:hypothetical protein
VGLQDQQQRSERGTTRAGVLLAVVDVPGLMVVLIRIGYAAHGLRRAGAGGGPRRRPKSRWLSRKRCVQARPEE